MSEVHGEQTARQVCIRLERLLCREEPGRHDDDLHVAKDLRGRIEGRPELLRLLEVAARHADRMRFSTGFEIACAALQILDVAAEQEQGIAARRHLPREGPSHALRGAEYRDLHAGSPRTRTD